MDFTDIRTTDSALVKEILKLMPESNSLIQTIHYMLTSAGNNIVLKCLNNF